MDRIQFRRDTLLRWSQVNPVLLEGEVGYVLDDPNKYKIGDGVHAWNELPLRGFNGSIAGSVGDSEDTVISQKLASQLASTYNVSLSLPEREHKYYSAFWKRINRDASAPEYYVSTTFNVGDKCNMPDDSVYSYEALDVVTGIQPYTKAVDNKYNLSEAITALPASLRRLGMHICFINYDNEYEIWESVNTYFTSTSGWQQTDGKHFNKKFSELESKTIYIGKNIVLGDGTTGYYYNITDTGVAEKISTSTSSIIYNTVLNKGYYKLQTMCSGSRQCGLISANNKVIWRNEGFDYDNPQIIFVPEDNCTLYISNIYPYIVTLNEIDLIDKTIDIAFINKGVISLDAKSFQSIYYENGSYIIDDGKIITQDGSGFRKEYIVKRGCYRIYANPTASRIVAITDKAGNILQSYSGATDFQWFTLVASEDDCIIYISSLNVPFQIQKIGLLDYLVFEANNKIDSKVYNNSKRGGCYLDWSTNLVTDSSYYMPAIDCEGYDSFEIVYSELSTVSWRQVIITDKDNNIISGAYEKGNQSITYKLPINAKYIYPSSATQFVLTLYQHGISNTINNVIDDTQGKYPLSRIDFSPCEILIFSKIVCVGDSLTAGAFDIGIDDTIDIPKYSYPTQLQKLTGIEVFNAGISGSTATNDTNVNRSWFAEAMKKGFLNTENMGDCLIIGLGTNDITQSGFDGDVSTDINDSDYNQNALTSVGGYAKIIQYYREQVPNIPVFCISVTNDRNTQSERDLANSKIKAIAEHFNAYYIDLSKWSQNNPVDSATFEKFYKISSHNNALGYNIRARQIACYIDFIIKNHISDFKKVQFIGTDYNYDVMVE